MDRWVEEQKDKWMIDGWTDGGMDGGVDEWMDRWRGRWRKMKDKEERGRGGGSGSLQNRVGSVPGHFPILFCHFLCHLEKQEVACGAVPLGWGPRIYTQCVSSMSGANQGGVRRAGEGSWWGKGQVCRGCGH